MVPLATLPSSLSLTSIEYSIGSLGKKNVLLPFKIVTATEGGSLPAISGIDLLFYSPFVSVTVSVAVYGPGLSSVTDGSASVTVFSKPLPVIFHSYFRASLSYLS